MRVYEVGGAVRDSLLGAPVGERDWVVVGASPVEMLKLGYRQVGKDFPVFLHPETGEEYALARTEIKTGPGYTGFEVHADPDTTLEEDLARRDLTINAIARDEEGALIDPYGGVRDVEQRVLRHVSDAFSEDPLRVLRVARFMAQLARHDFKIAEPTRALMAAMTESGEIDALRPERVWLETRKALVTARPDLYFATLRECGALARVFPEVDALFGVPQPPRWHPEVDTGVHTLMALKMAAQLSDSLAVRFAVLVHDLGKGTTPENEWPSHRGHGKRSVELIGRLCERIPVPGKLRRLAEIVAEHHGAAHQALKLRPGTLLKLIERADGLRQPERFEEFVLACEADARGRLDREETPYPEGALLRSALDAASAVTSADVDAELDGSELGQAIREERLRAIERLGAAGRLRGT